MKINREAEVAFRCIERQRLLVANPVPVKVGLWADDMRAIIPTSNT